MTGREHLVYVRVWLSDWCDWNRAEIESYIREQVTAHGFDLGYICQLIRSALTGTPDGLPAFEILEVLGRDESLARIDDVLPEDSRRQVQVIPADLWESAAPKNYGEFIDILKRAPR